MLCFCYIVECADGSFYTGWTTDPARRVAAHNAGRGSRYTRARLPVRLVLLEPQKDRIGAMKRERGIKAMTRSRKTRLVTESFENEKKANVRRRGAKALRGRSRRALSIRKKRQMT
jgi:putative endonuclease